MFKTRRQRSFWARIKLSVIDIYYDILADCRILYKILERNYISFRFFTINCCPVLKEPLHKAKKNPHNDTIHKMPPQRFWHFAVSSCQNRLKSALNTTSAITRTTKFYIDLLSRVYTHFFINFYKFFKFFIKFYVFLWNLSGFQDWPGFWTAWTVPKKMDTVLIQLILSQS